MWFKFSRGNVLLMLFFFNLFIHFGNFALIETGYKNDKGTIITNYKKNVIELLKCTYLQAGINHLKLTKLLFGHKLNNFKITIPLLLKGNTFVKQQIGSLYLNNTVGIGSLWLLNMYISTAGVYLKKFSNREITKEDNYIIIELLKCQDYVLKKLLLDSEKCDTNSQFNIDNMGFNYSQKFNYKYIFSFILRNINNIEYLINKNNSNGTLVFGNIKVFSRYYLYFKIFGINTTTVLKLINSFNLRIQWGDITKKLNDIYTNADKLDWPTTKLSSCLLLYSTTFDLFKVIMLRLTWKQFLYIKHQDASLIKNLTKQWLMTLKEFAKYLALENDNVIKNVIDNISLHIKNYPLKNNGTIDLIKLPTYQKEYTDKLVNYFNDIISLLCEGLGCTIVENWNTQEVLRTSNQVNFYIDFDKSSQVFNEIIGTYENNFLNETINFGEFLNFLFKDIDFNVIRSFNDYLITLNTYSLFSGKSLIDFDTIKIK